MPSEPKDCWGCGQPLIFTTMGPGQVVAFLAKNTDVAHSCPRHPKLPPIFLPAMQDCREQVKCECGCLVYRVPARNEMKQFDYALQFERVFWQWKVHNCGLLPGLWDYKVQSLTNECLMSYLSEPYQLVTVVSAKTIAIDALRGDKPRYLIALKSVSEERFCTFYDGDIKLSQKDDLPLLCGSLAVLCGSGSQQRLLINWKNKNSVLVWGGDGNSDHLGLSPNWWNI